MSSTTATTRSCRRARHGVVGAHAAEVAERSLVDGLIASDEQAIVELYRRYGGRILGIALRVLQDRQLAEEAVQETVMRVWRHARAFDRSRDLEPWLFRIARNTVYDMARHRARRPQPHRGDSELVLGDLPENDVRLDPPAALDDLQLRWEVRAAIDALPDGERAVVRLQHLDGLTHQEIAIRLDLSVGTVKSRSHRAHAKLAEALAGERSRSNDAA